MCLKYEKAISMGYVLITHLAVVEAIGSTSWSNLIVTNIHRYELRLMYQVVYLDANNTDKQHFSVFPLIHPPLNLTSNKIP